MGKLVSTSPPPIEKRVSWGSWCRRPLITSPPNVPTTYREEGLVGKLVSTSPPPIQMRVSWGSCLEVPG